mgnify:CR=1 FL=1
MSIIGTDLLKRLYAVGVLCLVCLRRVLHGCHVLRIERFFRMRYIVGTMKNTVSKFILSFLVQAALLFFPAAAESSTANSSSNANVKSAKDEGKQILSDLGSALKNIGTSIGEEVDKGASKARVKITEEILGTWVFANGNASTTIVCNKDETMTITQKGLLRKRSWTGTFNALGKTITFSITGTDNSGEVWDLKYKVAEENKMQITSDTLPDDYNKYDFSNTATFIKKE